MDPETLSTPSLSSWITLRAWANTTDPVERARRIATVKAAVARWPPTIQRASNNLFYELATGRGLDLHPLCNHIQINARDITDARMPVLLSMARRADVVHLTLWGQGTPLRAAFLEQLTDAGLISIDLTGMSADEARAIRARACVRIRRVIGSLRREETGLAEEVSPEERELEVLGIVRVSAESDVFIRRTGLGPALERDLCRVRALGRHPVAQR